MAFPNRASVFHFSYLAVGLIHGQHVQEKVNSFVKKKNYQKTAMNLAPFSKIATQSNYLEFFEIKAGMHSIHRIIQKKSYRKFIVGQL